MLFSVIISTYNAPQYLDLVLDSYAQQTNSDFEIVIADDGSSADTRRVIQDFQQRAKLPVKHIWQEDQGFRKARIMNEAIKCAEGEYIICTDQDCLVTPDLIATYMELLRPNTILQGARVRINREESERFIKEKRWSAMEARSKSYSLLLENFYYSRVVPFLNLLGGYSFCLPKQALNEVHGYDRRHEGWGWEDSDLSVRLKRKGYEVLYVGDKVKVYHLWHPVRASRLFNRNMYKVLLMILTGKHEVSGQLARRE